MAQRSSFTVPLLENTNGLLPRKHRKAQNYIANRQGSFIELEIGSLFRKHKELLIIATETQKGTEFFCQVPYTTLTEQLVDQKLKQTIKLKRSSDPLIRSLNFSKKHLSISGVRGGCTEVTKIIFKST